MRDVFRIKCFFIFRVANAGLELRCALLVRIFWSTTQLLERVTGMAETAVAEQRKKNSRNARPEDIDLRDVQVQRN